MRCLAQDTVNIVLHFCRRNELAATGTGFPLSASSVYARMPAAARQAIFDYRCTDHFAKGFSTHAAPSKFLGNPSGTVESDLQSFKARILKDCADKADHAPKSGPAAAMAVD